MQLSGKFHWKGQDGLALAISHAEYFISSKNIPVKEAESTFGISKKLVKGIG